LQYILNIPSIQSRHFPLGKQSLTSSEDASLAAQQDINLDNLSVRSHSDFGAIPNGDLIFVPDHHGRAG